MIKILSFFQPFFIQLVFLGMISKDPGKVIIVKAIMIVFPMDALFMNSKKIIKSKHLFNFIAEVTVK